MSGAAISLQDSARVPNGIEGENPTIKFEQYERQQFGMNPAARRTDLALATLTSSSTRLVSGPA